MALLYVICKDKKEAEKISAHLLKKRMIACLNMFPVRSMYWWNQKIVTSSEYAVLAKTNNKNYKKATDEIKKIHSYDIPCILRIEAKANKEYEDWINREAR
ncbi:divalent-cation tolerance protein CutA [Candidatus Woesearchaeota archaeon]|nr:divalent-cation tolerance protein CutA [Candidatus Woesearchaeota archaeon]